MSCLDLLATVSHGILFVHSIKDYRDQTVTCQALFNQVAIFYFGNSLVTTLTELMYPASLVSDRMRSVNFFLLGFMIAAYIQNYYSVPECMSDGYRTLMYWYVMPIFYFGVAFCILVVILIIHLAWQNYQQGKLKKEIENFIKQGASDPNIMLEFYQKYEAQMKNMGITPGELLNFKLNLATTFDRAQNKFETKECNICYDEYAPDSEVSTFPNCKHLFHFECLQNWLIKSPLCPCCKAEFRIPFAQELIEKSKNTLLISITYDQIVAYEKTLITLQPGLRDPIQQAMDQAINLANPQAAANIEQQPQVPAPQADIPARRVAPDGPLQEPLIERERDLPVNQPPQPGAVRPPAH